MEDVIQNIRKYLKDHGIKQRYLADRADLSKQTVSKILRGERELTLREYLNICKALEVPAARFMSLQGSVTLAVESGVTLGR